MKTMNNISKTNMAMDTGTHTVALGYVKHRYERPLIICALVFIALIVWILAYKQHKIEINKPPTPLTTQERIQGVEDLKAKGFTGSYNVSEKTKESILNARFKEYRLQNN